VVVVVVAVRLNGARPGATRHTIGWRDNMPLRMGLANLLLSGLRINC